MHFQGLMTILKTRRDELGITQEHLAELSEVGLRTLKRLEKGKGNPTFRTLNKLVEVLGMEIQLEVKKSK